MPLGNLTSQFFANVYLNELDQFVKHKLKAKHYIRYVDDFVLFHQSKDQLTKWKAQIRKFLKRELNLELHPNKSNTLTFNNGITFLGFKIFFHHRLLRKSNVNNFDRKFNQLKFLFKAQTISRAKALESFEGWLNYASHANTYKYRKHLVREFNKHFPLTSNKQIGNKKKHTNFMRKLNQSELKFSVQKTLFLFNKNLSIQGIAKERQIKESTVWQHLAELIKFKQIPLRSVVSDKKIRRILSKVYSKKDKLKEIKRRLKDDSISYDEIYCVLASIK